MENLLNHVLIRKPIYKIIGFFNQNMVGRTLDMHKRAFQSFPTIFHLKRTFTHFYVSGLHPAYFDLKNRIGKTLVF